MNLKELLIEIESPSFSAKHSTVSSLSTFENSIRNDKVVIELLNNVSNNKYLIAIFRRIIEISKYTIDLKYEHPLDSALAVYLISIWSFNNKLGLILSPTILKINNIWWSKKVAQKLLDALQDEANNNIVDQRSFLYNSTVSPLSFCNQTKDFVNNAIFISSNFQNIILSKSIYDTVYSWQDSYKFSYSSRHGIY